MSNFFGDSDTAKSVHSKGIDCLATETLEALCGIIQFTVKLYLEVYDEEVRCTSMMEVASSHSGDGVG